MLKILLVEGEAAVLESLRKSVHWEECGYTCVGEASDGELAYTLIKEKRPDVIITNIQMPLMDGLELSRLVRSEMPDIKIIILTGCSDFRCVQRALRLGVSEYLLTPAAGAVIVEALARIRKIIEREREQRDFLDRCHREGAVGRAESTNRAPPRPNRAVSLSTLDAGQIDKTLVERFLRSGVRSEARALVEELFGKIGRAHAESLLLRQYLAMDIHFTVSAFVGRLGIDQELLRQRCGAIDNIASELSSVEGTKRYLSHLLTESVVLRDEVSQRRCNALIREAQGYIEENYNSDISLNKVAKFVNVSPTHFSALFRQETGTTFIEHLTSVRMGKARELLCCTAMKASEVAYETGYHDPHYFSHLFKKVNGCTPRDFRYKRKAERCRQER
ncbi:MAG: helix-turn-helix domain-containing protein [Oscillospiraceae bacterium]|jgi:YesN/AraC family two-component response regulator|nr:helix-turn-helix domain-containing protein [Oscillospiraceae bacterium]